MPEIVAPSCENMYGDKVTRTASIEAITTVSLMTPAYDNLEKRARNQCLREAGVWSPTLI